MSDIKVMEESIKSLSSRIAAHERHPYSIAEQVFGILKFYREMYASSEDYVARLNSIIEDLRKWADCNRSRNFSTSKFLFGLADLLEECNKGGEWPGLTNKE
ncbi:MAG: hypothetical protein V3T17_04740 [Pseudomonadales bacterium]